MLSETRMLQEVFRCVGWLEIMDQVQTVVFMCSVLDLEGLLPSEPEGSGFRGPASACNRI